MLASRWELLILQGAPTGSRNALTDEERVNSTVRSMLEVFEVWVVSCQMLLEAN